MPSNLIFTTPGNYTIEDNGIPDDNTSVIHDGTGAVIYTFVHPADSLGFTVSSPGVQLTINLTDSLGAADLTVGSLTSATASPDSITIGNVRTTGAVTLASNTTIRESGIDSGADVIAGSLSISAVSGIGTATNRIETQASSVEAETTTGGIYVTNFGTVTIGGPSADVSGLSVAETGNIIFENYGSILLGESTGGETVHGGVTSGNVTLTALGYDSDIIATTNQDAIGAAGGNIVLNAARDIGFGIVGTDFDNDVRARGGITINAGRDVLVDGFSDIASDDFGGNTGGNLVVNAGRNIHVRNIAGTDGSLAANGSGGADLILTTGAGGALVLDAPTSGALFSSSGDVIANADRILIAGTSGITASAGQVVLSPATAGREIDLGSVGDSTFAQEISDAELDRIFTPTLTIGNDLSGQLTVSSAISPASAANLVLRSGVDIAVQAGITTSGSLELRAGDGVSTSATITVGGSLSIFVDTLGNDGGAGGFAYFGTSIVSATSITINGAGENDTLHGFEGVDQTVHGNGGNDTIISSGEGHYLGDAGNDLILAGLSSGAVPEVLDGGSGIDTLDTRTWSTGYTINLATGMTNFDYESFVNFENVIAGEGDDQITGTAGDNVIRGEGGRDYITAANGNDTIYGGDKGDFLFGNKGNDFIAPGAGADQIDGGSGFDRVWYGDSPGGVTVDLMNGVGSGNDAAGDTYVGIERVTGSNYADNIIGNELGNALKGGTGDDIIYGKDGRDIIEGQGGKDQLYGNGGNDNILGGADNDKLYGNSGSDKLDGGSGNDQLAGGADADYFIFQTDGAPGFGGDVVLDFQNGIDKLDMRGVYSTSDPGHTPVDFADLTIGSWTHGVKIVVQSSQIIYLDDTTTGISVADIDASDFLFA